MTTPNCFQTVARFDCAGFGDGAIISPHHDRGQPGAAAESIGVTGHGSTLENNGKFRPEPDRENAFARASGGEGGRLEALKTKDFINVFRGLVLFLVPCCCIEC
jgi:hypothetical protein